MKRSAPLIRTCLIAFAAIWLLQLLFLYWFLGDLTWQRYWLCRGFYRLGLMLFSSLGQGILPGSYFSPFNRAGAIAGFAFASFVYSLFTVLLIAAVQFCAPPPAAPRRR